MDKYAAHQNREAAITCKLNCHGVPYQAGAQMSDANYGLLISVADLVSFAAPVGLLRSTPGEFTMLYRAVSPEEFASIGNLGGNFSFGAGMQAKQFGLGLSETLTYANTSSQYAAIIGVRVPTSALQSFEFSRSIDPFIFRSGVVTVNGQSQLGILNQTATNVKRAF